MAFNGRTREITGIRSEQGQRFMIQQFPQQFSKSRASVSALPLAVSIWVSSYLAIDLIMWMGGRSSLVSNIVISLPMMITAPALTISLERLRRHLVRFGIGPAAAILVPAAFLAAIAQILVDYSAVRIGAALLYPEWQNYVPTEHRQFGFGIYIYAVHFLCCLLALSLLQARQSVAIAIKRQTEAASAHRRAEAKALRLQLNPHFLFNALNSIAGLVATGGNRVADAMICRLSDFMRACIVADPESDVSLSSEIATTDSYLAIEQLRFGDRLSVSFALTPDALDAAIPAFILQPLAENAVKHGLAAPRTAIRLAIDVRRARDLVIIAVTNRHTQAGPVPDPVVADGMGIGLRNVRDRVALFGAERAKLETETLADGFCARVTIPYRRFTGFGETAR